MNDKGKSVIKCFKCIEPGHVELDSQNADGKHGAKNTPAADDEAAAYDGEVVDPLNDGERDGDDIMYGDGGISLLVRKSLMTQSIASDNGR